MSVFYGWKISALSLAGNFMLQGAALYGMNAFMEPLCLTRGWSRMGLNFSLGAAALAGQLAMPLAAAVAARFSLRALMGIGALVGGLSTCLMGFCDDIKPFTLFFILVWIASQFCGGVVANALMSAWFSHYRGVALGLANSGASLSGMILPLLALTIINHFNITTAFVILGVVTCALAPLSWYIVRRNPEALRLYPDGRRHAPRVVHQTPVNTTLKALIHRPAAWYIGIAFGLALMSASGILSQLKPRFADNGVAAYTAMLLASLSALFGTLAKYFWGWVCDVISPIMASRLLLLVCLGSLFIQLLPPTLWTMGLFGVLFACGTGGLWVVLPATVASYFGAENFLGVYKFVTIFLLIRCLGFPVMGVSHELMGNYALADIIFGAALFAAFCLTLKLKPEKAAEARHKKTRPKARS